MMIGEIAMASRLLVKDEPRHKAGQQIVSVLIVRISYLARTFLGLTRIMKQIFLAFKNSPRNPLRRSPRCRLRKRG